VPFLPHQPFIIALLYTRYTNGCARGGEEATRARQHGEEGTVIVSFFITEIIEFGRDGARIIDEGYRDVAYDHTSSQRPWIGRPCIVIRVQVQDEMVLCLSSQD
jgi:hypothetical protein